LENLGRQSVPEGEAGESAISPAEGELGRGQAEAGFDHGL